MSPCREATMLNVALLLQPYYPISISKGWREKPFLHLRLCDSVLLPKLTISDIQDGPLAASQSCVDQESLCQCVSSTTTLHVRRWLFRQRKISRNRLQHFISTDSTSSRGSFELNLSISCFTLHRAHLPMLGMRDSRLLGGPLIRRP